VVLQEHQEPKGHPDPKEHTAKKASLEVLVIQGHPESKDIQDQEGAPGGPAPEQPAGSPEAGSSGGDDVIDADFEEA
jgi:hypothetical protein